MKAIQNQDIVQLKANLKATILDQLITFEQATGIRPSNVTIRFDGREDEVFVSVKVE